MQTTFENAERQHLRKLELERHLQVIASAGTTSDLELFSDNLDIPGLADGLTGQPLNKAPPLSDASVSSSRRPRGRSSIFVSVAIVIFAVIVCSLLPARIRGPASSVTEVIEPTGRYRHLFSLILDFNITKRAELEDRESPQSKALHWLAYKDTSEDVEDLRTRYSLATLYFSTRTNETDWVKADQWMSPDPVCFWYGVKCLQTQAMIHRVQYLNLSANGLVGSIPEELSLLQQDCHVLDLSYNQIGGRIPVSLGKNLQNLQRLYLGPNALTSTIPESLFELQRLTHLYIDSCHLNGTLSGSIHKMTSLHGLALHDNQLTGNLPESLGGLTGLRVLNLDENRFKGRIPTTLGSLTGLVDLRLDQNLITGFIPSELASLSLLEILYLDTNKLTGTIPNIVAESMPFLTELHLHNNALTGSIPKGLASAPFLQVVYLDGNNLTGEMPAEICQRRRDGMMEDLWADCAEPPEVKCSLEDCCTRCFPQDR